MKKGIVKSGNARVEIERVVLAHGFRPVKDLKRNERHWVFVAENRRGDRVVAKATAAQMEMENMRNETRVHAFLRRRTPKNARFAFPEDRVLVDNGSILVTISRPYLESGWLAKPGRQDVLVGGKLSQADMEDLFQLMLFLHSVPERSVPKPILARAKREYTRARVIGKMRDYLAPAIGSLLTAKEAGSLEALMKGAGWHRRFVHQDLLPANLARLPDGRLLAVDAEFARWGMKWFDIACVFLQFSVLYRNPREGKRVFHFLVRRFREVLPEENLAGEIFAPLAYMLSMEFFIAAREPDKARHVTAMFKRVIRGSLEDLLAD